MAQSKVITLETQPYVVNARWKRVSQPSFTFRSFSPFSRRSVFTCETFLTWNEKNSTKIFILVWRIDFSRIWNFLLFTWPTSLGTKIECNSGEWIVEDDFWFCEESQKEKNKWRNGRKKEIKWWKNKKDRYLDKSESHRKNEIEKEER